jgi:hypothetical protein
VAGRVCVGGGVAVGRLVAAADVPAFRADPQVEPRAAGDKAVLAAVDGLRELAELDVVVVTAEDLVSNELHVAGIAVASAQEVEIERRHFATLVLRPSGRRLEVDRVLALPGLRGRPIAGIPTDSRGFVDVDEHCRVRGLDGVWAAGDKIAFR